MPDPFLTSEWRKLAMANYIVDPSVLEPYVPNKTRIDFFKSQCSVSLVAFMFIDTRVKGIKIPFHVNFEEVNLRFYVKQDDKHGVVFIKEIVGKPAVSFIAGRNDRNSRVRTFMAIIRPAGFGALSTTATRSSGTKNSPGPLSRSRASAQTRMANCSFAITRPPVKGRCSHWSRRRPMSAHRRFPKS